MSGARRAAFVMLFSLSCRAVVMTPALARQKTGRSVLRELLCPPCGLMPENRALHRTENTAGQFRAFLAEVERFFALLADKQIKRGAHRSVKILIAGIMHFIAMRNDDPTPLRWTKSADDILASIERYCQRTLDVQTNTKAGG